MTSTPMPSDEQIDAVTLKQWGEMKGWPLEAHRKYARAILSSASVAAPAGEGEVFEAAMKMSWQMVDPLRPPPAGSYNRGEHNGTIAALKTVRDNYRIALARLAPSPAATVPPASLVQKADAMAQRLVEAITPEGVAAYVAARAEFIAAAMPPADGAKEPSKFTWHPKACPCGSNQCEACMDHGCEWERDPSKVPLALRVAAPASLPPAGPTGWVTMWPTPTGDAPVYSHGPKKPSYGPMNDGLSVTAVYASPPAGRGEPVATKLICPTCGIDRYKEGCSRHPCGFVATAHEVPADAGGKESEHG